MKRIVITIIVMLFIVSIIGVAKWSLKFTKDNNEPSTLVNAALKDDDSLNVEEKNILIRLSGLFILRNGESTSENIYQTVYFNNLYSYLKSTDGFLSPFIVNEIDGLITNGEDLIKLETHNDFYKMSFDARELVIYILKQIYQLNGLTLTINMEGSIQQISDKSGNIIFKEVNSQQGSFQVDALIITLTIFQVMLFICYAIAKKTQYFKKEGAYGLIEKGIA